MIRFLLLATTLLYCVGGLSSCIRDKKKEADEVAKMQKEIEVLTAENKALEAKTANYTPLPNNWKEDLDKLNAQKMKLEADITDNDATLNELKADRDRYVHRLQEFRLTHPINQ